MGGVWWRWWGWLEFVKLIPLSAECPFILVPGLGGRGGGEICQRTDPR